MSNFRRMDAFLAVADSGSFRAAAKRLGVAPSVISSHVRVFEEWIGAPCLEKARRGGQLTIEGQEVASLARRIRRERSALSALLTPTVPGGEPTLAQIETFIAVSELGSVTRAADRLNVTQAAATRRLQALNVVSVQPLFMQQGRNLVLTGDGRVILNQARAVQQTWEELHDRCRATKRPVRIVHVGLTELTALSWFPAFAQELRRAMPHVVIYPDVDLATTLAAKLRAGLLDLAFLPTTYVTEPLRRVDIGTATFAWLCAPGLLPEGELISDQRLAQLPLLVQGRGSGINAFLELLFAASRVKPVNVFASNHLVALGGLLEAGIGVSCLPIAPFRRQLAEGSLRIVHTTLPPPDVTYCTAFLPQRASLGQLLASIARRCCRL